MTAVRHRRLTKVRIGTAGLGLRAGRFVRRDQLDRLIDRREDGAAGGAVRREPIAGVPDIDLRQGHLPIQVQELTVCRDLASPRRRLAQECQRELRGRAEDARRKSRDDGRDQRPIGE
jgi:hypothetical protein